MNFLIHSAAMALAIVLSLGSSRSVPLPESEASTEQDNLILFEVPVADGVKGAALDLEGDSLLVQGKRFSSVKELGNVLAEERAGRSSQPPATAEPFHLVVPVARNFSSLKELSEILREDRARPQLSATGSRNLSYVRGTEEADVMIFFTS